MNCCVVPLSTVGFAGVMASDCRTGAVTVNWAVPVTPPSNAAMVTGPPVLTPVASPWAPLELLMVAMLVFDDDQVTDVVRVWVELSE